MGLLQHVLIDVHDEQPAMKPAGGATSTPERVALGECGVQYSFPTSAVMLVPFPLEWIAVLVRDSLFLLIHGLLSVVVCAANADTIAFVKGIRQLFKVTSGQEAIAMLKVMQTTPFACLLLVAFVVVFISVSLHL
jgi:hypothetical protein